MSQVAQLMGNFNSRSMTPEQELQLMFEREMRGIEGDFTRLATSRRTSYLINEHTKDQMKATIGDYKDDKQIIKGEHTDPMERSGVQISRVQQLLRQVSSAYAGEEIELGRDKRLNPNYTYDSSPAEETYFADDGDRYTGPRVARRPDRAFDSSLSSSGNNHIEDIEARAGKPLDPIQSKLAEIDERITQLSIAMTQPVETNTFDGKMEQSENNLSQISTLLKSNVMGSSKGFEQDYFQAERSYNYEVEQINKEFSSSTHAGLAASSDLRFQAMGKFNDGIKGMVNTYYPPMNDDTPAGQAYNERLAEIRALGNQNENLLMDAEDDLVAYDENRPPERNHLDQFFTGAESNLPSEMAIRRAQEADNLARTGSETFTGSDGWETRLAPIGSSSSTSDPAPVASTPDSPAPPPAP